MKILNSIIPFFKSMLIIALMNFSFGTPVLFAKSETHIRLEEVQSAKIVRDLIKAISQNHSPEQLIPEAGADANSNRMSPEVIEEIETMPGEEAGRAII